MRASSRSVGCSLWMAFSMARRSVDWLWGSQGLGSSQLGSGLVI